MARRPDGSYNFDAMIQKAKTPSPGGPDRAPNIGDAVNNTVDRPAFKGIPTRKPLGVDRQRELNSQNSPGYTGIPRKSNPDVGNSTGITKRGDGSSTMGEELTPWSTLTDRNGPQPQFTPAMPSNRKGPNPIEDRDVGEAVDDPNAAAKFAKGGNPPSYSQQIKDNLAKTAQPRTAKTTPVPTTPPGLQQTAKFMPKQMAKRGDGSWGPSDVDTYGSDYAYDYPSSLEGKPSVNSLKQETAGGQSPASPSGWQGDDVDGSLGQGSTRPKQGGPGYPAANDLGNEYDAPGNLQTAKPSYAPSPSMDPADTVAKMAKGGDPDPVSDGFDLGARVGQGAAKSPSDSGKSSAQDLNSQSGGEGGMSGKSGAGVTNTAISTTADDAEGMAALAMAKSAPLPSKTANVSPAKAKKILKDGQVNGKPLTSKQRKMFGVIAGQGK